MLKNCQWLQKLHSYGLLSGSFRPDNQICMLLFSDKVFARKNSVLRSYIRQRDNLIKSACVHVQRMQKALTEMRDCRKNYSPGNSLMNLQLHRVISDITGTTGLSIIKAIVAGECNPLALAALKDGRIKAEE